MEKQKFVIETKALFPFPKIREAFVDVVKICF